MKTLKAIAYGLVIIGALNWGLVGAFEFDLVKFLLGDMTILSRIVYILVGLSAIVSLMTLNCDNMNTVEDSSPFDEED